MRNYIINNEKYKYINNFFNLEGLETVSVEGENPPFFGRGGYLEIGG